MQVFQMSSENHTLLSQLVELIQIKSVEIAVLERAKDALYQKAIVDAGGDPEKRYTVLPDGRIFEEPELPKTSRVLMAVPSPEESPAP